MRFQTRLLAWAAAMLSCGAPATLVACGDCVVPTGGLGPTHPHSMQVALAIRQAMNLGIVEPVDEKRYQNAWNVLNKRSFLKQTCEVLLIEDGSLHAIAAVDGSNAQNETIKLVTGRAVLQALAEGRLHLENAVSRGLVILEPLRSDSATSQRLASKESAAARNP